MARPLGSGPIHVYIGFGPPEQYNQYTPIGVTSDIAIYYGTTRSGPEIDEVLDYYQIMNDITGPRQSMDEGFAGREDRIALVMTSWSQIADNRLEHFLDNTDFANPRGTDRLSDLGTLMLSEGKTLGLWLVKAAGAKAINIASGMPRGRYYPTVIMNGPNKPVEGNKENMRIRIFTAKKNVYSLNQGVLPLFREDDLAFSTAMLNGSAATFG